jgi:hypothetical protein
MSLGLIVPARMSFENTLEEMETSDAALSMVKLSTVASLTRTGTPTKVPSSARSGMASAPATRAQANMMNVVMAKTGNLRTAPPERGLRMLPLIMRQNLKSVMRKGGAVHCEILLTSWGGEPTPPDWERAPAAVLFSHINQSLDPKQRPSLNRTLAPTVRPNGRAEPHGLQNRLASSAASFFPSSIMSAARPSHVCSTVIAVMLRTPINRSQNSMYLVTYSKPGGGTD